MRIALWILLAGALSRGAAGAAMQFTEAAEAVGIGYRHEIPLETQDDNISVMSGGGAAEDFDGDGWIDLYLPQGREAAPAELYMNNGDGTFREEAAARGAEVFSYALGAAAADFDNDGDVDLCVTNILPPHLLLINDGSGHFTVDATTLDAFPAEFATSPSWGDIDNDGLLDLMVGQWNTQAQNLWVYRNVGNGALGRISFQTSPHSNPRVFSPGFADVTVDRRADLLVAADFGNSQLYLNEGDNLFRNVTATHGTGIDRNGMGTDVADYDNDGDLDWFVTSIVGTGMPPSEAGNRLYRNRGDGRFDDVTFQAGINDGGWGWGAVSGDFDLDGDLDIFHVNGWIDGDDSFELNHARLFENDGQGVFAEVSAASGVADDGQGRGVLAADFDNDGDQDLFVIDNAEITIGEVLDNNYQPGIPAFYRNDTERDGRHWLKVRLAGEPPLHRHGIGSRVYVETGGLTQMRELNASTNYLAHGPKRIAHFGLGEAATADEVRAEWVNGDAVLMENVAADREIVIPGPQAEVSRRRLLLNQQVSASGENVEPTGTPRRWTVEGQTYADPLSIGFSVPGSKELRLDIFEPDGETRLRSELIRIEVDSVPLGVETWGEYR